MDGNPDRKWIYNHEDLGLFQLAILLNDGPGGFKHFHFHPDP